MPTFCAPDGIRLAYRESGEGEPLLCLPGGPTDARYLGDLGGLSAHRRLILLDPRGTGGSAVPEDTSSYRSDRQVEDVEALRAHLGLPLIDLLAHSAGTNTAMQYAARYPQRLRRLVLVGPSTRAVGITVTGATRRETAGRRAHEPWFPAAFAALEALTAGTPGPGDVEAVTPFFYGRWDAAARAHHALGRPANSEAVALFGADGAFTPAATRAALADLRSPVLLLTGEFDLNSPPAAIHEVAALFPAATLAVQPSASHYPWLDAPAAFTTTIAAFLGAKAEGKQSPAPSEREAKVGR
ncbi:alpha/beta hydrolase [Streptomyces cocklensis]|uniref:Pimeloyl-ACP methyl ester carboxylesterase n=1 Tax=Actinacidiphila cocklensis TaxID=887465 RepID=A0A9W4DNL0_9ACTN|nr:alpha/beta hydrolase [Actinacidiphila cocklensis]MDD1061982.1 alpha/beta hydrolase [Actinacidiphila cocklensis]CAG6391223.1 Pimeloyl-ACP methyl ester carboxylesterase [Actinacidiphila cocklensis]